MNESAARDQLSQMIFGLVPARMIFIAAELQLADLVADAPRSPSELADATGTHADSLHRLLRTLAGMGIFAEDNSGRFSLTPMADLLRSDSPSHMRDFALMIGGEHARAWLELGHSIRTGQTAFDHVFGMPIFEHLKHHPDEARTFDGAMTGIHGPETKAMIEGYDFCAFESIVDIGGGNASALLEILGACPSVRGVVFDLPHVVQHASDLIAQSDLSDRCRAEAGDFFKAVPSGADCYVMRHIIHDWDDEKSITILKRCREAMRPGAKVLVVEYVIPEGNEPHFSKLSDLIMLVIPGGRERTEKEYDALFSAAGLTMTRIVPTASSVSLVEGVAV